MPRPLRIQYANAWYHVMNRGAGRKKIFKKKYHRQMFLDLLEECHVMFNLKIYAYCLMDNHYHLLVSTPEANLSRVMRHLDGVYTQRFNRSMDTDGALFRGRYTAKLIEDESYQAVVSQYIHFNPVVAAVVKEAHEYEWSSYRAHLGLIAKPLWLCADIQVEEFPNNISVSVLPDCPIIGSKSFMDEVILNLDENITEACKPDINRCRTIPKVSTIIDLTCNFYGINHESIQFTKRNTLNLPRLISMYISRKIFGHTLRSIGESFNCKHGSTVSSYLYKFEKNGFREKFQEDITDIVIKIKMFIHNEEKVNC